MPGGGLKMALLSAGFAFGGGLITGAGLTTALTYAAISGGASFILNALAPKPPKPDFETPKTQFRSAVQPAQWVIGRAATAGLLTWIAAKGRDLHYIEVLSEGSCDRIERVWARGEEVEVTRTLADDGDGYVIEPVASSPYRNKLYIREYFAGDGTQGSYVQGLSLPGELQWTAQHRLENKSFVYVRASGTLEDRFWQGTPSLLYQIKGIKIENDLTASGAVEWTNNAALVMWWLMQTRRGIPKAELNKASFVAGHAVCDVGIGDSKRYEINGIISADEDMRSLMSELELCFDGSMVEFDGVYYFRPGAPQTPRLTITADDIVATPTIFPAPSQNDRLNAVQCQLIQSKNHDFQELEIAPIVHADGEVLDGEYLPDDLGKLRFINSASAAHRILSSALYQARASLTMQMSIRPGHEFEMLTIMPADVVRVTLDEAGLNNFEMTVVETEVQPNFAVNITLRELPLGAYNDSVGVPADYTRTVAIPTAIPSPSGVAVVRTTEILPDGSTVVGVKLTWDSNTYRTRVTAANGTDTRHASTLTNSQIFLGLSLGTWTFTLYHVDRYGKSGQVTQVSTTITLADIPAPPKPRFISMEQQGRQILFLLEPPNSNDITGFEVRYQSKAIGTTDAFSPIITTEAGWNSAGLFGEVAVPPSRAGQHLALRLTIPKSARYYLYARYISNVGKYSAIVGWGEATLQVPSFADHFVEGWATWEGTRTNYEIWDWDDGVMLIPECARADATPKSHWQGSGDFPFGSTATATYASRTIDVGASKSVEVQASYELFIPSAWSVGTNPPANQITFNVQHRTAESDSWTNKTVSIGASYNITDRYFRVSLEQARNSETLRALKRISLSVKETV